MNELEDILREELTKLDIKLEASKIKLLCDFWSLMEKWNRKSNLTRITGKRDFAIKHVTDSLSVLKYINIPPGSNIIDIGSGPGVPGIVLKIARPDVSMTLLDTQRKKTDFLKFVIEELKLLKTNTVNERAEKTAQNVAHREKYDFSIARAVSAMNVLSELCLPFVKLGGFFVAMKGPGINEELEQAKSSIDIMGGQIIDINHYFLSDGSSRSLVFIKKYKNTPDKFPRKPGIPLKRPL